MSDHAHQRITNTQSSKKPPNQATSKPIGDGFSQKSNDPIDNVSSLNSDRILQLQQLIGNQAVMQLLRESEASDPSESKVQRAFEPVKTNKKTHLRLGNRGHKVGRNIPNRTEILADKTDVRILGTGRKKESWTRAVDVSPDQWDPATSKTKGGFVRGSKIDDLNYPIQVPIPTSASGKTKEVGFLEDFGLYETVEDSLDGGGKKIIKFTGGDHSSLDTDNTANALSDRERSQIQTEREAAAQEKIEGILRQAAITNGINPDLFATPKNIAELNNPLRLTLANYDLAQKGRWYEWVQDVYAKITSGANDVIQSILHWRSSIYPPDVNQCIVTKIELEGSDLHDKGLGALFVTYSKPNDDNGMFPNVDSIKVVLKPEDRSIEKSLFGDDEDSLASQVNELAELNPEDAISTIKMKTHHNYGTLIEFVRGELADNLSGSEVATQSLTEGIAFAFLAGMSDVHRENVIWKDGKPYFIDADNSLNASKIEEAETQSGFTKFNQEATQEVATTINEDQESSNSQIIQKIIEDSTPFIEAIRTAFAGKTGRIVPLYTNFWANRFKQAGYIGAVEGNPADVFADGGNVTRWMIVNHALSIVKDGEAGSGTGLIGESGESPDGGEFDAAVEKAQTKLDLDQGKIPFYTYDYSTGHIMHNGQIVWKGQSIDDAMELLLQKFPAPEL